MLVSLLPQIRLSAMLLLHCGTDTYSVEVTFKCNLNRDNRSDGSTHKASGHTQTVQRYKLHNDWLSGKESFLKSKLLTSSFCSCVLVCLPVAFKFLNHVTACYKSGVNFMMTLGGIMTP